jgi:hypothetical protein
MAQAMVCAGCLVLASVAILGRRRCGIHSDGVIHYCCMLIKSIGQSSGRALLVDVQFDLVGGGEQQHHAQTITRTTLSEGIAQGFAPGSPFLPPVYHTSELQPFHLSRIVYLANLETSTGLRNVDLTQPIEADNAPHHWGPHWLSPTYYTVHSSNSNKPAFRPSTCICTCSAQTASRTRSLTKHENVSAGIKTASTLEPH